jgi:hypothetical protein
VETALNKEILLLEGTHLKEEILKEEMLRVETALNKEILLLEGTHLKEEILKEEMLKEVLRVEILKEEILKEEILKEEILKDPLLLSIILCCLHKIFKSILLAFSLPPHQLSVTRQLQTVKKTVCKK